MPSEQQLWELISAESFLEYAFLRWILTPAVKSEALRLITAQQEISIEGRNYLVDYAVVGRTLRLAIELDGFEFHGSRAAFTYDRLRQNDLQAAGWTVVRFSYDSIRLETSRCVSQLRSMMALDPLLVVEQPEA